MLCVRYGVYKIETVGDAYLAVAGAPTPSMNHALQICDLGQAIVKTVAQVILFALWERAVGSHRCVLCSSLPVKATRSS